MVIVKCTPHTTKYFIAFTTIPIINMTILLNTYIIFYIINLFSLAYLFKSTFNNNVSLLSLPYIVYFISKFSKLKPLYYGLILNLVGIPPFLFFFIKFNFLIHVLPKVSFYIFYILFLVLFLHMIFYIQGLYLKNIKVDLTAIKFTNEKINYNHIYFIVLFLMFSYLNVFFYIDLFITLTLVI